MKYFMKVKPSYNIKIGSGSGSETGPAAPIDEEAIKTLIKEETSSFLKQDNLGTIEDVKTLFRGG